MQSMYIILSHAHFYINIHVYYTFAKNAYFSPYGLKPILDRIMVYLRSAPQERDGITRSANKKKEIKKSKKKHEIPERLDEKET